MKIELFAIFILLFLCNSYHNKLNVSINTFNLVREVCIETFNLGSGNMICSFTSNIIVTR